MLRVSFSAPHEPGLRPPPGAAARGRLSCPAQRATPACWSCWREANGTSQAALHGAGGHSGLTVTAWGIRGVYSGLSHPAWGVHSGLMVTLMVVHTGLRGRLTWGTFSALAPAATSFPSHILGPAFPEMPAMGPPDWVSAPAPAACVSLIAIRTKGPDTAWFVICVPSPAKNHSRPGLQLAWQEPQPSATPGAQGVLVLGESRRDRENNSAKIAQMDTRASQPLRPTAFQGQPWR